MANTVVSDAVRAKQWDARFFKEYVRANRFKRYMGANENAIIQVKENLTKAKGDALTLTLVGALDSSAGPNTGGTTLVGNEKALPNDGHLIEIGVVRDAVVVSNLEEQASAIAIRDAGKMALKDLAMRYMRNDIITALGSVQGTAYGSATEGNKDAWLTANADRALFGSAKANQVAGDSSASLLNVDSTDDKLTGDVVSLAKRMAQQAVTVNGDGIRPYRYGEDQETFVMFVPTDAFRDLRIWLQSNSVWQDAMERGKGNPLFSGPTSIYWDGVVVREIPEIATLAGVGATGEDVAPCYLCGAQALGVAWAQRTKTTLRKEDDYGYQRGVGFQEMRGIEKLMYGQGTAGVDWSLVSVFVSGVADG